MIIQIKNRLTNKIIVEGEYESIKDCLEKNRNKDFTGADLSNMKLYKADLHEMILQNVDFRGSDLRFSKLYGSVLRDADFRGAEIWGSNINGANLLNIQINSDQLIDFIRTIGIKQHEI